MEDKISVIIPVYNVENYLRQCVDSVIEQTYLNIEIILVDDGSKDTSGDICNEYASKYDFIITIHKKNEGLGMARNTGMEHMTGKYVTFVDSDDWIDKDLLKTLYNNLILKKVDFCKSGFKRIKNDGTVVSITQYKNEFFNGEFARKNLLSRMIGSSPSKHDSIEMCVCGVLYDADIIRSHHLRFPSEREMISEDLVFNIDYMQFVNGACTIDVLGYKYRINDNSLTKSYRTDRYKACAYFYTEIEKKLKELEYDNNVMLRLKRMFFIYVRMCIHQETHIISKLSQKENRNNIKNICRDPLLNEIIKSYPIYKLGVGQLLFLWFIKLKAAYLLQTLAEVGII